VEFHWKPVWHSPYRIININKYNSIVVDGDSINLRSKSPVDRLRIFLSVCLSSTNPNHWSELYEKAQLEYFANYLRYYDKNVGFYTQTIVVEYKYMSLTFLKDYSKYYSISYQEYSKFTRRIHFFEKSFSEKAFKGFLVNDLVGKRDLSNYYLGHIVVKPLSNAVIGTSLIRNYDEYLDARNRNLNEHKAAHKTRNREFKATRNYRVDLFGKEIKYNTLVFQEQDRAVSACATIALWMSFHALCRLFNTKLPVPSDVTQSAGLDNYTGRVIPNSGLELRQIINAIDNLHENIVCEVFASNVKANVALERQLVNYEVLPPWKIKRYIYSYVRLGIPVLLGYNQIRDNGFHLVAITGYRFNKQSGQIDSKRAKKETNELKYVHEFSKQNQDIFIQTKADRIFRLYAHDDQLGPFSKIGFNHRILTQYIRVNWRSKSKYCLAIPKLVIVPIIEYVRINYNVIDDFCAGFQKLLNNLFDKKSNFIWDIYLDKSANYKKEISSNAIISQKEKHRILTKNNPRYIWVAKLYDIEKFDSDITDYELCFDIIFDASQTPSSLAMEDLIFYEYWIFSLFKKQSAKWKGKRKKEIAKKCFSNKVAHLDFLIDIIKRHS